MSWLNAEMYPDPTAGEAMERTLREANPPAEELDDEGCALLTDALILQAARDYAEALRDLPHPGAARLARQEIERFFRSARFRRLTVLNGEQLIRKIRKAVKEG